MYSKIEVKRFVEPNLVKKGIINHMYSEICTFYSAHKLHVDDFFFSILFKYSTWYHQSLQLPRNRRLIMSPTISWFRKNPLKECSYIYYNLSIPLIKILLWMTLCMLHKNVYNTSWQPSIITRLLSGVKSEKP